LPAGTNTITVSYGGDGNFLTSAGTLTVTIKPSIIVLDPTASGALTISGNASIALTTVSGSVFVDSSSSSALAASGNAQVGASVIDVRGGVQRSGNASFNPAPITRAVPLPDPLAGLASPSTTGLTNHGSENLSGNSRATISPGIYTQINVSGNATLTLGSGIYIIEGGGLTVSGNAGVAGTGVMIYNAGSNYPSSGGNFGGITLSGNGTFSMTAPTTGPYAGVLIFQSRQNTRALSFSGNAMAGMTGTIYAASALFSMSGNSQLQNPLVVGTLNLSGNISLTETATGTDGAGDAVGLPNTLMAGDLSAYINDPGGLFTADELARIQDAINDWDALLAPYSVTITEVSDPTLANIVIDTSTTSASGGADAGVLGCYNAATGEITVIQGWNWYAGSDTSQIGADQYDFETTVTHELGHALGLGHSTNTSSPMYATLATGVANRTVTTPDLNIPDPPGGADPQIAAGFQFVVASPPRSQSGYAAAPGSGPSPGATGLMPLSPACVTTTSFSTGLMAQSNLLQQHASMAQQAMTAQAGPEGSPVPRATDRENQRGLIPWLTPAATDQMPALDPIQQPATSTAQRAIQSQTGHEYSVVPQPTNRALDYVLDELVADSVIRRAENAARTTGVPDLAMAAVSDNPAPIDLMREQNRPRPPGGFTARLAVILLAAGSCGYGAGIFSDRNRQSGRLHRKGTARLPGLGCDRHGRDRFDRWHCSPLKS
jgi:Matrixin